jgi:hypothetical protein
LARAGTTTTFDMLQQRQRSDFPDNSHTKTSVRVLTALCRFASTPLLGARTGAHHETERIVCQKIGDVKDKSAYVLQ